MFKFWEVKKKEPNEFIIIDDREHGSVHVSRNHDIVGFISYNKKYKHWYFSSLFNTLAEYTADELSAIVKKLNQLNDSC